LGGLSVLRDVTEKLALRQQIEFNDRLTAMGRMAAGVAHEVNNPLMAVAANLHYVFDAIKSTTKQGPDATNSTDWDELLDALGDAQINTKRIRDIVTDLGSFSRHSSNLPQRANVAKVAQWAIASAAPALDQRATTKVTVAANLEVVLAENRLGQVFVNLLTNAAQAMPPSGYPSKNAITIEAYRLAGNQLQIVFNDNGPGIPEELLGSIFDPFVTTKGGSGGSGLGLFVCHGIVTSAGGQIEVESSSGSGTTFRIQLPSFAAESDPS
jgi:signal transduction histidine kinase